MTSGVTNLHSHPGSGMRCYEQCLPRLHSGVVRVDSPSTAVPSRGDSLISIATGKAADWLFSRSDIPVLDSLSPRKSHGKGLGLMLPGYRNGWMVD